MGFAYNIYFFVSFRSFSTHTARAMHHGCSAQSCITALYNAATAAVPADSWPALCTKQVFALTPRGSGEVEGVLETHTHTAQPSTPFHPISICLIYCTVFADRDSFQELSGLYLCRGAGVVLKGNKSADKPDYPACTTAHCSADCIFLVSLFIVLRTVPSTLF